MEDSSPDVLPEPPTSLIRLEPGRQVNDIDEEIFLLYTLNAHAQHDGRLGYVNHGSDNLWLAINGTSWSSALSSDEELIGSIVVRLCQDVTSLRSSRGNTGSVLWRSTVHLAIQILQDRLFDLVSLRDAKVLELGSGTGALPALVASHTATWLATDQEELLPLMNKNIRAVPNCQSASLNWFDFLDSPSLHETQLRKKAILDHFGGEMPDLVICSDCVYNPALFNALIATLNAFTKPAHTMVLMSCEMRSDETMAEFLFTWTQSHVDWQLISLEERLDKGFVAFAAWKISSSQLHVSR